MIELKNIHLNSKYNSQLEMHLKQIEGCITKHVKMYKTACLNKLKISARKTHYNILVRFLVTRTVYVIMLEFLKANLFLNYSYRHIAQRVAWSAAILPDLQDGQLVRGCCFTSFSKTRKRSNARIDTATQE